MGDTYADQQADAQPTWLQVPAARRLMIALGLIKDATREAARAAVLSRFAQPSAGDPSALRRIASTRQIDVALGGTVAQAVAQLRQAFDLHRMRGSKAGLLRALQDAGYPNAQVYESWDWSRAPGSWWRFWVVLPTPHPVDPGVDADWLDSDAWLDGDEWQGGYPDTERERLRRIVRLWKPAHAVCDQIVLVFAGYVYGQIPVPTYGGAGAGAYGDTVTTRIVP